jgi:4'-phosphopantetheinyl transferase
MGAAGQAAIPPLQPGRCQVWWASTSAADDRLLDLLDEHERRRHADFLREADRARFVVAHALARVVAACHVSDDPRMIRYDRRDARASGPWAGGGKPRFTGVAAGLQLSISHSGERVAVAVSQAVPVGVDVERVQPLGTPRSLVESVLGPDEQDELTALPEQARAWAFSRYWTRKEAILKAAGLGLSVPPDSIAVTGATRPPALVSWTGRGRPTTSIGLHDLDAAAGYTASLATLGSSLDPSEHDGTPLLRAWT